MRTSRAALILMRLYGDPPLEGGGGGAQWEGQKRLLLYQIFVKHILHLNSYIPVPSLSVQNHAYHKIALGPNRFRTAPPVYCTFPIPLHINWATEFNPLTLIVLMWRIG